MLRRTAIYILILLISSQCYGITFFVGRHDPNIQPIPFELVPNQHYNYAAYVWWRKHWRYLYKPRIVQTADLWPVGAPDGVINLFDYAVFAQAWLTEGK